MLHIPTAIRVPKLSFEVGNIDGPTAEKVGNINGPIAKFMGVVIDPRQAAQLNFLVHELSGVIQILAPVQAT